MQRKYSRLCVAAALAGASLLAARATWAATLTWDGSGVNPGAPTDGSGNWDTVAANWTNGGAGDVAWDNVSTAVLGDGNGTANYTVTIDDASSTVSVAGINFNSAGTGNYTVAASGSDTLTLTGPTITVAAGVSPTISAAIAGSAGLSLFGGGTLTLAASNGYTGNTSVDGGSTLVYTADNTSVQVLAIGATPTASTASTVASSINASNANVTATGLVVQTNTASANTITVGSGKTLTVNGGATVGVADVYEENNAAVKTSLTMTGGGSFVVNGGDSTTGNFQVAIPRSNTPTTTDPVATLNMSGLTNFTYSTSSTGEFRIGQGGNDSATATLATNNTIKAAAVRVGDTGSPNPGNNTGNNGAASTLTFGNGTDIIDANQITIGNGKSSGTLNFSGTGATVTIANQAGTGNANITLGNASSASNGGGISLLDLTGENATVSAGTVIVGRLAGSTGGTAAAGTIKFDTGTFNVATSLQLGAQSSTSNSAAGASGTFTLGGGILNASGAFTIVNRTVAGSTSPITGTFNVNGGTANINTNITTVDTTNNAATRTASVNLAGGTLDMHGNSIGTSALPINLTATSGTLQNLAELNGGGTLTKTGAGTLVLGGTDTYTGATNVSNGTLFVNGTHTGGGGYTVSSGATLGGVGSTASAVSVASGGFLAPGDAMGTLGVGSTTLQGTLVIGINDSSVPNVDVLNDAGAPLDISAATSAVTFNVSSTLSQPAYVFADYSSLTGSAFAAVNNLPAGYSINYNYQGNNDIALVAAAVPEPASLGFVVIAAGLLSRRRRKQR